MGLTTPASHTILPRYIDATSLSGLERKIQLMQFKKKKQFQFINIYFDSAKNRHVAWYYEDISNEQLISEEMKNGRN